MMERSSSARLLIISCLKVIGGSGNCVPVTFLVRGAAFFDRFFQTVVEVFVLSAFRDLGLIVEFDLIDQQAGKTLGLAVNFLILGEIRREATAEVLAWSRPGRWVTAPPEHGLASATAD